MGENQIIDIIDQSARLRSAANLRAEGSRSMAARGAVAIALGALIALFSCEARSPLKERASSAGAKDRVEAASAPQAPAPVIEHVGKWQGDGPQPVVVMMHGFNSTARDFEPAAELAASLGFVALSLPAPIEAEANERYQWERDDVEATHAYVQRALNEATAGADGVDLSRVWLVGFSQGGAYAALLSAAYPERYRGALAIAPAGWVSVPKRGGCPRGELERDLPRVTIITGERERERYAKKTAEVAAFMARCELLVATERHEGGHQFPLDWPERFMAVFESWR